MTSLKEAVYEGNVTLDQLYQEFEQNIVLFRVYSDLVDKIQELEPEWWENYMLEFFEENFTEEEIKNIFGLEE